MNLCLIQHGVIKEDVCLINDYMIIRLYGMYISHVLLLTIAKGVSLVMRTKISSKGRKDHVCLGIT